MLCLRCHAEASPAEARHASPALPRLAVPGLASPRHACVALPGLASPGLAKPALPSQAKPCRAKPRLRCPAQTKPEQSFRLLLFQPPRFPRNGKT